MNSSTSGLGTAHERTADKDRGSRGERSRVCEDVDCLDQDWDERLGAALWREGEPVIRVAGGDCRKC